MKSIKPGRGPSGLGLVGAVGAMVFGVFWTIMAVFITSGAPGPIGILFPMFGIVFIVMAGVQAAYHYKNATGLHRFSEYDITDETEEGDPSRDWVRDSVEGPVSSGIPEQRGFCPYCGTPVEGDFSFCRRCGKKLKG